MPQILDLYYKNFMDKNVQVTKLSAVSSLSNSVTMSIQFHIDEDCN